MTKIGKSVWIPTDHNGLWRIDNKNEKYLVVGIVEPRHTLPDGSINNDWNNHLVLQAPDGTITSKMECYCIICPDDTDTDDVRKINQYLNNNGCNCDVFSTEYGFGISISWGDWKHEHAFCDQLMAYLGYNCDDEIVTEENGSDCYSAEHYYSKVE